jgi:hypothetical protein
MQFYEVLAQVIELLASSTAAGEVITEILSIHKERV